MGFRVVRSSVVSDDLTSPVVDSMPTSPAASTKGRGSVTVGGIRISLSHTKRTLTATSVETQSVLWERTLTTLKDRLEFLSISADGKTVVVHAKDGKAQFDISTGVAK